MHRESMKKFDYYIGIDVSKLTLDVTFLYECENTTKTEYYKIKNNEKNIAQFVKKKLNNFDPKQILFCFEDTGIYSLPLAYYLSENNILYWQVASMEIKRSKGITRGKSDKIDSKDIAYYAYSHMQKFRPSNVAPKSIQQLRLLFTEREKILKSLSSFEKTSENKDFVAKEVFQSVATINKTMVKHLKSALKKIEEKMLTVIAAEDKLNQQFKLVTSIPGIGRQTAIYLIIATKGFESFENWRQLACYAGVAPFPYQSGTSIMGRNKVHHLADKKLKSLLNMCALVAISHDKELKTYYERKVKDGKSKMLVLNNVRCKLLSRVFAVINRKTPFINTLKFAS
jgi:transposase